jgi:RimJ/RimL family protein N-acetyltransferase
MEFTLRPWSLNDLGDLIAYANNFNVAKNLTNQFPHPYGPAHGKAFIKMANAEKPLRILAIDIEGKASGAIGLHPQADIHCKNAELGYWLAEPFWGKGIMAKAVSQVVDYGFKNFDLVRIFARPFGTNLGSQRVLEKAGFSLEARLDKTLFKNGEYLDELIYAVRRG